MSKLARAARPPPERTIKTTTPLLLLLDAAGANGLLTGASLDQSIKQLPARCSAS
jgi:hypothetical protein